jgi:regulator of sigma E protease
MEVIIPDDFYRLAIEAGRGNFIGTYRSNLLVDSVIPGKSAESAGLKKGDHIFAVNGERIFSMEAFRNIVVENTSKPITLDIKRNDVNMQIQPVVGDSGVIGIIHHSDFGDYARTPYTIGSSIRFGASDAMEAITSNIKGLKQIFIGKEKATDSLQGPIGIATIYGGVWDWRRFWTITGLLSMVLAFMNILPIPALDGGHVLFLTIESITRRKLSDKFLERAQVAGMVILLSLMVFTIGNDIWKHIIN